MTTEPVMIHDQTLVRGQGGELHQIAKDDTPVLTTAQGGPVLQVAGIADKRDEGTIELPGDSLATFVDELGKLRVWAREPSVKLGKASVPVKN